MSNAQAAVKSTSLFVFDGAGAHPATFASPFSDRLNEATLEVLSMATEEGDLFFGSPSPHPVHVLNSLLLHGNPSRTLGVGQMPVADKHLAAKLKEVAARFVQWDVEYESRLEARRLLPPDDFLLTPEVYLVTQSRRTLTEKRDPASRPAPIFPLEVLYRAQPVRYARRQRGFDSSEAIAARIQRGYYTDLAMRVEQMLATPESRARQRAKASVFQMYGDYFDRPVS